MRCSSWGRKESGTTGQHLLANTYPGGSVVKNPLANTGGTDSVLGLG